MITIIVWTVFGLLVGIIAKAIHPGQNEPKGFLATMGIGIAGSYIGGVINWMLHGGALLSPSGVLMSVLGAVILCAGLEFWSNYLKNTNPPPQPPTE